jgi:ATP-dependent protease Clp ATPase subunit
MLDIMYEIPSNSAVKEVVLNGAAITEQQKPIIILHDQALAS